MFVTIETMVYACTGDSVSHDERAGLLLMCMPSESFYAMLMCVHVMIDFSHPVC